MSKDAYQSLTTYNGDLYGIKPSYQGIEYDFEVPSNLIVASPGGVDSRTGHYTKGFYGRGNTSSDAYAGQGPRYISGVYGNLYQSGQTSSQAMGIYPANQDYQFYQNYTPQQYIKDPTSIGYESSWMPERRLHEGADPPTNTNGSIEGYQPTSQLNGDDSFEVVDEQSGPNDGMAVITIPVHSNSWLWITLGILLFFSMIFMWSQAVNLFAIEWFNKGNKPSWKLYMFWAVCIGILLAISIWFQKVEVK